MNSIHLIGRITKDIELKHTINNKLYVLFTLAVPREYDKEKTDFISCLAWEKRAETIQKYTKKGSKIAVSGRLEVNNKVGENGEKIKYTTVIIETFKFLEYKNDNNIYQNKNEDEDEDFPF